MHAPTARTDAASPLPYRVRRRFLLPLALLAAGTALLAAGCTSAVPEVQRLSRYEDLLDKPLAQRVLPADDDVLDRAQITNRSYGKDVRPTAVADDDPLLPLVRRVLAGLPPKVAQLARAHLVAVYVVANDEGTATTEGVWSEDDGWGHAYIVLNATALTRTANEWATWKERSAFRPQAAYDLRVTLEPKATDDREGAVRFILLHEMGHVLGLGLGVHGYWDAPDEGAAGAGAPSPFANLSWAPEDADHPGTLRSRHAGFFPGPYFVDFYQFDKARSDLSAAPAIYAALSRTDFPSLYGTVGVYDDFAESFAIYVHTRLLGKPYRVDVFKDGQVVERYHSCIATGDCPRKVAILEDLLGK